MNNDLLEFLVSQIGEIKKNDFINRRRRSKLPLYCLSLSLPRKSGKTTTIKKLASEYFYKPLVVVENSCAKTAMIKDVGMKVATITSNSASNYDIWQGNHDDYDAVLFDEVIIDNEFIMMLLANRNITPDTVIVRLCTEYL